MIVYHGSNRNFRTLRIEKKLVRSSATMLNEGMGIYFSTDKAVAASYGEYVYTIEINDTIMNFRSEKQCIHYTLAMIQTAMEKTDINILQYINIKSVAQSILDGQIAVYQIYREIELILDSVENWHILYSATKKEAVIKCMKTFNEKSLTAYMFNYSIPNIGIIKKVEEQKMRIIKKEKIK